MDFSDSSTDISRNSTPFTDTPTTELSQSVSDLKTSNFFVGTDAKKTPGQNPQVPILVTVKNICCVGAGYVGGPTAAVIAFRNPQIHVNVVDLNDLRIRKWNSKHPPVHEPGLIDVVRVARDGIKPLPEQCDATDPKSVQTPRKPNLFFSTEVARCVSEADVVLMSVNTPTKVSGIGAGSATNLIALESAVSSVALWAKPGAIIVEKSTVPCRTAQMIRETLSLHRPNVPFEVLSNPEFLAEGTAVQDLLKPDRILIGSLKTPSGLAAAAALKNVYAAWVDPSRIITVNLWSSELSKLVANAMLAQRVSSINSISAICEKTGADIGEIAHAVGMDKRLGPKFLKASLGFGGSCFKKDILNLVYMARTLHLPEVAEYWMQVLHMNDYQRDRFVRNVVSNLHSTLTGKKLAVLGWTFKENTNDTRESPAIEVVRSLLEDCPSEIAIFDPGCNPDDIKDEVSQLLGASNQDVLKPKGPVWVYTDVHDACRDANAVLILTPWDEFRFPPVAHKSIVLCGETVQKQETQRKEAIHTELANEIECDTNSIKNELPCDVGCRECERAHDKRPESHGNIDWQTVSNSMKKPKWVFDGRGLVDVEQMEGLGFRVETIGKVATRSRLNGIDF